MRAIGRRPGVTPNRPLTYVCGARRNAVEKRKLSAWTSSERLRVTSNWSTPWSRFIRRRTSRSVRRLAIATGRAVSQRQLGVLIETTENGTRCNSRRKCSNSSNKLGVLRRRNGGWSKPRTVNMRRRPTIRVAVIIITCITITTIICIPGMVRRPRGIVGPEKARGKRAVIFLPEDAAMR